MLIRWAVGFIMARRSALTMCRVSGVNAAATTTKSDSWSKVSRSISSTPAASATAGNRVRVVRDVAHAERSGDAMGLLRDAAEPDGAEGLADQPGAASVLLVGPATLAGQPVLFEQASGKGQDEGQIDDGHRPLHRLRGDRQEHPVRGAGRDVDVVVADAEARDQSQALVALRASPG